MNLNLSRSGRAALICAFGFCVCAATGCGNDDDDNNVGPVTDAGVDTTTNEPWIQIGTGVDSFEIVRSGQDLDLVFGPQGGYHVWGAFAADNINPSNANIRFVLVDANGNQIGQANYFDSIDPVRDYYEYTRVAVALDFDVDYMDIDGREATLAVQLTDGDGLVLEDRVRVVPVCCAE